MEPAKIDWKKIESVFVEDALYENINAPKWVDLISPDSNPVDDDAWFCRPDCKHPKTAEDFLRSTPTSNSKLSKLASVYDILPLGEKNQRDVIFKRKGATRSVVSAKKSPTKDSEDSENQNPNIPTPQKYHTSDLKSSKGGIKLDSEKKKAKDDASQTNAFPKLKSTLSARNLFAGRDLLNQITEFCSELKKLATRGKDKEGTDSKPNVKKDVAFSKEKPYKVLAEPVGDEKERKPLLEVSKDNGIVENGSSKGKQWRIKRADDAENTPITLNLENVKDNKQEERLLRVRVSPPTPQCFSAARGAAAGTASKAPKSRLTERQILQEVKLNKEMIKDENNEKEEKDASKIDGKDPRPLDVFWFLKPCALSS